MAKTKPNSRKPGQQGSSPATGGKPIKGARGGAPPVQRMPKPKAK